MHALLAPLAAVLTPALTVLEEAPADEDVVAGWMGFAVFAFLIVAVALLGWSLTKQLRKAQRAEEQGVYGSDDAGRRDGAAGDQASK